MHEQLLCREDWIVLRGLDKSGRVVLVSWDSEHVVLLPECWKPLVKRCIGAPW